MACLEYAETIIGANLYSCHCNIAPVESTELGFVPGILIIRHEINYY